MTQTIDQTPGKAPANPSGPDLVAIKSRQRVMWASGDFAVIGTTLQIVGESLCEAAGVSAGSRVLDVACGNGNATLAAARRFCQTTGVDYVPELLARARERAQAERLKIEFIEGDAEALPFAEATFDSVLSTYGVMFAANQSKASSELVRVCKTGGKIALANWTPEGFLGELFRTVGRRVPPPAGLASPLAWGTDAGLATLFGAAAKVVKAERKDFVFRYESAQHMLDVFRNFYGPTHQAFKSLDEEQRRGLEGELLQLFAAKNTDPKALAIPGQYLEVVLEKR